MLHTTPTALSAQLHPRQREAVHWTETGSHFSERAARMGLTEDSLDTLESDAWQTLRHYCSQRGQLPCLPPGLTRPAEGMPDIRSRLLLHAAYLTAQLPAPPTDSASRPLPQRLLLPAGLWALGTTPTDMKRHLNLSTWDLTNSLNEIRRHVGLPEGPGPDGLLVRLLWRHGALTLVRSHALTNWLLPSSVPGWLRAGDRMTDNEIFRAARISIADSETILRAAGRMARAVIRDPHAGYDLYLLRGPAPGDPALPPPAQLLGPRARISLPGAGRTAAQPQPYWRHPPPHDQPLWDLPSLARLLTHPPETPRTDDDTSLETPCPQHHT